MFLSIIAGLIVSIDAFFIGISLGLQKKNRFSYLIIINFFLFILCFIGYFIAAEVYENIPFDPDYVVGTAFILLGLSYIVSYFVKKHRNRTPSFYEEKGTLGAIGLVMSLEAMLITMGITIMFMPEGTWLIPFSVAIAHFAYSALSFSLVRTRHLKKMPVTLSHVLSGAGLIIYGLLALFLEIGL